MKRIVFLLLFLLLLTGTIFSQNIVLQYTYQIQMQGQTATGTSSGNITNTGSTFHQFVWNVSGTVSTCTVAIDSSADGITWTAGGVIAAQTCTSNGSVISGNVTTNFIRINLTALTGAGATFNGVLTGYNQNPVSNTANFINFNPGGNTSLPLAAANTTKCWIVNTSSSITTSKVSYNVATADNTADLYDIGFYSVSGTTGTLVGHIGATAGTTFAPATGSRTLNWLTPFTITAGTRYAICVTDNVNTAVISGNGSIFQINGTVTSNSTTASGVLNSSIGFGADSNPAGFSTLPNITVW